VMPFRVFDKIQTVAPGAIVENKQLGRGTGVRARAAREAPMPKEIAPGHSVACHLY
jgi:hypothetical protein